MSTEAQAQHAKPVYSAQPKRKPPPTTKEVRALYQSELQTYRLILRRG